MLNADANALLDSAQDAIARSKYLKAELQTAIAKSRMLVQESSTLLKTGPWRPETMPEWRK